MSQFSLRSYQSDLATKGCEILQRLGIVYLSMQPRTGKTHTGLQVARLFGAQSVLFLTKKIAIDGITADYIDGQYPFQIQVANNESLHKVEGNFDLIISDEHHRLTAFPKPNKTAKDFKQRFSKLPMIFLSGTPAAESGSQWFHTFWVSERSPFQQYKDFYRWADDFVKKYQANLGYGLITKYERAKTDEILQYVNPYLISYTQQQSGFQTKVQEHILQCEMKPVIKGLIDRLTKDLVIEGKDEMVIADTAVKLQGKILQLASGTIKFESGNRKVLDCSKGEFIKERFKGKKLAIFYYFIAELQLLKQVFGDTLTDDLHEFNETDKHIALQQIRGAEGISLKAADVLVFMNFGFSCVKYLQAIDRLTTIDRSTNDVYFVMSAGGIEQKVYKTLQSKKDYSSRIFLKDFGIDRSKFKKPDGIEVSE